MNPYVYDFLKKALGQVKYKKMHAYLAQELNDHIESLKEEMVGQGLDEETAYQKAVDQMGRPEVIGKSLHEIHKPRIEWGLVFIIIGIIFTGIFSLGVYTSNYPEVRYFEKQLLFIAMGIVSFLILYYIEYSKLEKISGQLYIVASITIIVASVTGISVNGIARWLAIGPIMIKATHIAMPLFILSYVGFTRKWANRGVLGYTLLTGTAIIAVLLCMGIQSIESIYLAVTFLGIFIAYIMSKAFKGNRKRVGITLLGGSILGMGLGASFILSAPWRVKRIMAWIDPSIDPVGEGYLTNNIREILSGAIWFGKGEGIKIEHMNQYLPSVSSDFIFTFIIGTMGYLVAAGIVLLVGIMLIRCFNAVKKVNDEYGRMLLNAISIFFAIQYIMSLLMNIGVMPVMGNSIPFISYGGSRIILDLGMMGFFLGIYRRKDIVPYELLKAKEESHRMRKTRNKRYNHFILGWALNVLRTSKEIEEVCITFKQR